jgi:hypothetical protein
MRTCPVRIGWMSLAALLTVGAAPALAQPWIPPPGEGTMSVTFQNYYVQGHWVGAQGAKTDNGGTHSKSLAAEVDWGLPKSIGLTIGLPFIASKYTGSSLYFVNGQPTTPGPLDDGFYHGALQDLHVEARRGTEFGRVAVAPFVGLSLPTHEYVTQGEAVPGRHRTEFQIGASAGTDLGKWTPSWLPSSYVHGRYGLYAAETIDGLPSVRSLIDVEVGSSLTRRLGVRGLTTWQIRNKGPRQAELIAHGWSTHDRFVVSNYFNLGGGVTIQLRRSTELSGTWVSSITGNMGAHIGQLLNISLTREFGGGSAVKGLGASATDSK